VARWGVCLFAKSKRNSTHIMPAFNLLSSFLLLVPCLVAGATVRARTCPLGNCQNSYNADTPRASEGDGAHYNYDFLELASTKSKAKSQMGCGQTFTPAHFTCSSCDKQTCSGCNNVICDLSKCIGKFFSQECWCKAPLNPKVDKFFCDDDCSGGSCNTKGLTCQTREKACKPWWWCKLPPPKESFLQKMTSTRSGACAKRESSAHLNERLEKARAQLKTTAIKRQIADFDFQPGEFVCESALLPQPDEDPVTLAEMPAGFVVMDGNTCSGGFFKKNCFCYDKFLYLRGQDPKVTELQCDAGCGQGPCGGRTCGTEPPPPLPAPTPAPPVDPLLQELANEGMLRNYGTQMSPS